MKFSPHSFLMGADFVLGVVNEWKESTLLCENDLLCIVPLGWLSRLFIQKPLCWFRGRGNRGQNSNSSCIAPPLSQKFQFSSSVVPPFSFVFVCFSLPLPCSTLKSWAQRVCSSTTRQMVCEIILSRFSFCVSSETRVLLRYTRHIVQVLWLY